MKVKIKNFMCHKSLELDFNNLTILSGNNGSGKSAIFHAINWCVNGGTNNFITKGEKTSVVIIELEKIKIERGVKSNKYYVLSNSKQICTTKDSLKDLNIDLTIEFYSQFDKLFLLNETPKNQLEILNQMFEIEKVEAAVTYVNKDLRDLKKDYVTFITSQENFLNSKYIIADQIYLLEPKIKNVAVLEKVKEVLNKLKNIKIINVPDKISDDLENKIKLLIAYSEIKLAPKIQPITKDIEPSVLYKLKEYFDNDYLKRCNSIDMVKYTAELKEINKNLLGEECPTCHQLIIWFKEKIKLICR